MHPCSMRSCSECAYCLHRQQETGRKERSLQQQMWNYSAEVTSKIFDITETKPWYFRNQYVKSLNNLTFHKYKRIVLCVLRVTRSSRTAESCRLQHLSSKFINGKAACGAALQHSTTNSLQQWCTFAAPQQQKKRCWAGCNSEPVPMSLLHSIGIAQTIWFSSARFALC